LGASAVALKAFELSLSHDVTSFVVHDKDTVDSLIKFETDHQVLVEPSCGATLSVIYKEDKGPLESIFGPDKLIVVIVCGGSIVNTNLISEWKEKFLLE